ncbi:MAG: DUF885 domain-containing protein [Gammaproteobacteria bacterium]
MKVKELLAAIVLAILLASCSSGPSDEQLRQEAVQQANTIYADYFDGLNEFNPLRSTFMGMSDYNDQFIPEITAENRAKRQQFEQQFLSRINAIDPQLLTGQHRLTYDIFIRDRQVALEGYQFPDFLLPIDQMSGIHNLIAQLGSGQSAQPFNTVQDFRNFMARARGYIRWIKSAQVAMQEGVERDIVLPEIVVKKLLPQFEYHIVDDITESLYYSPLKNSSLSEPELAQIEAEYTRFISTEIIPSYRQMYDFLLAEYLPKSRQSVGLSELTDGSAWYEYQIKVNTTLDYSARELHELGKREVARILAEMTAVKEQVGFVGDLTAFFEHLRTDERYYFANTDEMVAAYDSIRTKINSLTPKLFNVFPKADYEVRLVEPFRAASSAGASYQAPSMDGSRPGIFYINGYNLKAQPKFLMETLSIHEASPGHHFQVSLQQEITDIPNFRRFGGYTVFAEGWALYAESLGKELGLFTDPYMWYGRLVDEQLRAMRLVVDTGLHAFGWTREEAIDYMLENSSMNETDVIAEVERYIVIPGQALSYKVGEFKIRELRNYAAEQLGDKFDVREFHSQILTDGAMPMTILDSKIKQWVNSLATSK